MADDPNGALPPWRQLLQGARKREGRSPSARWLQLATVAADGSPRVRTLVFRGWSAAASLDLLTDGRSAKSAELRLNPAVEVCWLLPKAKVQCRLRGVVQPLVPADAALAHHWQQLTPQGRALWSWPAPGEPYSSDATWPEELPEQEPPPPHFELLRVAIARVEWLDLGCHPHRRTLWRAADGWRECRLNP